MSKKPKYKFRLFSAVLATVCIILVGDAVAPTASIGNSQYVWWLIMILGFFIPYGLISAELGTQYPSEGGMYTWVKKAFGKKWAGRVAWYYWVNYPLWVASLADLVTVYLGQMFFGWEITWQVALWIQLGYILLVSVLGCLRISQSDWISNLGAVAKFIFMAGLGGLGIYALITHGSANPITSWTDFIPMLSADGHFDFTGLGFVSLIIFNMLGFEVVSTFSDDMENPKKEIPKAIIIGGILIAIFYLLPSFGIGVAIPLSELRSDTGLLESYEILMHTIGLSAELIQAILVFIGILFIYTLVANISSWNFGVNSVIACAAEDGVFPKSWAKRTKSGVPYVPSIWTGLVGAVIATAGILVAEFVSEEATNLFWTFFSLSLVTLLLAYLPMFMAFIKLHNQGRKTAKGFWIEGGKIKIALYGFVPFVLILIALFFTLFPSFELTMWNENWPLIVGASLMVIIGEFIVFRAGRKNLTRKTKSKTKSNTKSRTTRTRAKTRT